MVLPWMEEPDPLPGRRIKAKYFVGLRTIASLAGEREVFRVTFPAKGFRINVLNGMSLRRAKIRTKAILAIPTGSTTDKGAYF
jgi:hypothetical protein